MAKEAAKTGAGPTALIAIEQYFPKEERIVEDDLACQILPTGRAFLWFMRLELLRAWMVRVTEKDSPGLWSGMMCRKRYIDEKLLDSLNQIDAVVNLGAGFDTRAYRFPSLSNTPVWELDQPENIGSKQVRLLKVFGKIPAHVKLVAIDFDHEDLASVLETHGYSTTKRTFFVWEAVSQYLTEKGIRTTFDFLAKAASGSRLAFTYVLKEFLDGRAMYSWEKSYQRFVEKKIWIFGMEPEAWPGFLKEYGWRVIEDMGYDEMAENYVKPTGRTLASTPIERMVYAEKL
ncbi:SAM-dependent methyltransferase [Desulfosporosinus sp. PR]|uniref:SAM-dependent methyltransferase n=1 Tax=Candidatus Desulfosporosinus nitrosoreducens TaxID=3401928 RepID=UPI0027FC93BC|nr:SAM-dependent methyltransferase [Desulfosporosinus sp. PR]MDQ7092039.1 SAM-dependent methyltransferase [Desulfosporosinus sp. PR]